MEEALLVGRREELEKWSGRFRKELKKVSNMAVPLVAVTVAQYLLRVVSMMMIGRHLGQLFLSGVAIATAFANFTGFTFIAWNARQRIFEGVATDPAKNETA